MYKNSKNTERQTVPNGNPKITQNKFTKSLTSFHKKKSSSKNITHQNTIKKPGPLKQDKSAKTKRIYFSSRKSKDLGYLHTNPISPKTNKKFKDIINKNPLRTQNIPSSDQRLYKYKNGYILNIINNYKPNVIINNKSKNSKNISSSDKNVKNLNNNNINTGNDISNNNSETNSKNANGGSNNNVNMDNSLIQSDNFMNTIAITLTNGNYNENIIQSNYLKFNGFNGIRKGNYNNKSLSNLNDFSSFNSRNKILKKFKDKNNQMNKKKKELNSLKNKNINNIKKTGLIKPKSKKKIKTNLNTNSALNIKNNNKKTSNKSSTNIANSVITNTNSNTNINKITENNDTNKNIQLDEIDKVKNVEPNINNLYNNANNNNLIFETVDYNKLNEEFINHFNIFNIINTSNQRNKYIQNDGFNTLKTLNSMKSYQQSGNTSNNIINENSNINNNINIIENNDENDNICYQTFSGPFRKNFIKVNILGKEDNKNKKIYKNNITTKSANNLKANIISNNNTAKKDDDESDFQNKNLNLKDNEIEKQNESNNLKSNKNSLANSLNFNEFPISGDNSHAYVKKKTSNININKKPVYRHTKNNSVSSCIYKTQRNISDNAINNKSNKNNYLHSAQNNIIGKNVKNNSIVLPEYTIKLENIKSRVSNLLNVYSLLALRSLNTTNNIDINK